MTLYLYRVQNVKTLETQYLETFTILTVGTIIGWKTLGGCSDWKVLHVCGTRPV